jgi:acid phosphatase
VSKILVIMEENHNAGEVFPDGMPYLWQLARTYGHATAWSAITHPSLPNYLAIFSGSSFNDPQDCQPGNGCTYPGPSVFGQALAAGKTARSYEESMPQPCDQSGSGNYDVNHNPWVYIPGEAAQCRANDVPAGTTAGGALVSDVRGGNLPAVGLITPNLIHNAHNGTLAQADDWLRSWIPVLMSGPDWRSGRLAIAVVFDEGDTTNHVPFVLIAPGVSGAVVTTPANHYALTRLIDEVIGAQPLRHAAAAPSLASQFGLKLP